MVQDKGRYTVTNATPTTLELFARTHLSILMMCLLFAIIGLAEARPSTLPENAFGVQVGISEWETPALSLTAEWLLPSDVLDISLSAEVYSVNLSSVEDSWGGQLALSTLVFPAWGTTPPLSFGAGLELMYEDEGFAASLGPTIGTDLSFVYDEPIALSLYSGLGVSQDAEFFAAWTGIIRYYIELDDYDLALELQSNQDVWLSFGARVVFY